MPSPLHSSVTTLSGVGPAVAAKLEKLGITTIEHLLWHIPFRYEDFRTVTPIGQIQIGQHAVIEAKITLLANRRSPRKHLMLTEAMAEDASGAITIVWFNQPFLTQTLKIGDRVLLSGEVTSQYGKVQLSSPQYEKLGDGPRDRTLLPVYPTTTGLSQKPLRSFVLAALASVESVQDPLPESLKKEQHLVALADALRLLHFPHDEQERDRAIERLKFDELLVFQLRRHQQEYAASAKTAPSIAFSQPVVQDFVQELPFTLLPGQKKAAWDILQDMEQPVPMHRLVEGEVGSGKTVVAAVAAINALHHRWQVVLMAPTEILARQHFATLMHLFRNQPYAMVLWTHGFHLLAADGKEQPITEKQLATLLKHGEPVFIIGTHAVLQERIQFAQLGLVIIDEQQRFGVEQRAVLHEKGAVEHRVPHLLTLTATPIPRTLALALVGDLEISRLTQLPHGPRPVTTHLVSPEQRATLYQHLDGELSAGRQAFVIAPLIEESDAVNATSAKALFKELQTMLPHRKIGLLHGRLSSKEKDAALHAFASGETHVLVATSVIEVGIDVPNASVIVIEGAERFGLAQLHQLRGRIGRGGHASTCYLVASTLTTLAQQRLEAVVRTNDGFQLAEMDLKLRGPGDLAGIMQSGFLDFRFADLGDTELLTVTSSLAEKILHEDPELSALPLLKAQVEQEVRVLAEPS